MQIGCDMQFVKGWKIDPLIGEVEKLIVKAHALCGSTSILGGNDSVLGGGFKKPNLRSSRQVLSQ